MLYIDDRLTRHPKIMKAGQLLGGGDGPARALAVYLDGLSYAREYLTDGVIPDQFLSASLLVRQPAEVARVLARVGLWHRVRGGYRVHDFHDWNKTAEEIKKVRAKWRDKKAQQRRAGNGEYRDMSPGDAYRDSRARVRYARGSTTPYPGTLPRSKDPGTCTAGVLTDAARRNFHVVEKRHDHVPTHRVLCGIAAAELDTPGVLVDGIPDFSAWAETVKRRLVVQGWRYPTPHALTGALDAVALVLERRAGGSRR